MPLLCASSRYAASINVVPTLQGVQYAAWSKFVPFHELGDLAISPLAASFVALAPLAKVPWCVPGCPKGGGAMCLPPTRCGRSSLGPVDTSIPVPRRIRQRHPCERCGCPMQGDWVACHLCPLRARPVRRFTDGVWVHKPQYRCPGIATNEHACRNWDKGCKVVSTDQCAIRVELLSPEEYVMAYTDAMFRQLQAKGALACEAEVRMAAAERRDPQFTEVVRRAVSSVPNHPELYGAALAAGHGGTAEEHELSVSFLRVSMNYIHRKARCPYPGLTGPLDNPLVVGWGVTPLMGLSKNKL